MISGQALVQAEGGVSPQLELGKDGHSTNRRPALVRAQC